MPASTRCRPGPEVTDMRLVAAVCAAVFVLFAVACTPAHRVDLGRDAGYLIAAISGEPDQLDPQKTSAYFSPVVTPTGGWLFTR
ncbi:hypothetical protein MAUB_29130 [Mycolicibacterium aubagnense]|uniref:Uncharacterized protein n=1 Tax=Mycolicibacterium aubagnense TaxID=319707 RepID=A0ABN5YTG4_9MYCO|nr:hypothetical protein MAUB_29130 [Mycolicibacterium aubagnense]